jgi:hypothetical protein
MRETDIGMKCPNAPDHDCPYPKGQCSKACVDSWDGDNMYVFEDGEWEWTNDD